MGWWEVSHLLGSWQAMLLENSHETGTQQWPTFLLLPSQEKHLSVFWMGSGIWLMQLSKKFFICLGLLAKFILLSLCNSSQHTAVCMLLCTTCWLHIYVCRRVCACFLFSCWCHLLCVCIFSPLHKSYCTVVQVFCAFFEKCVVGFGIWNVCAHMEVKCFWLTWTGWGEGGGGQSCWI